MQANLSYEDAANDEVRRSFGRSIGLTPPRQMNSLQVRLQKFCNATLSKEVVS